MKQSSLLGTLHNSVRKNPQRFGLPNSLLNAAQPIGPSSMISSAEDVFAGLPGSLLSHGWMYPGIFKFDTANPHVPAIGFDPCPTAPSSLISPPDPSFT